MHSNSKNTESVGKYLVTPLTKITDSGQFMAAVSIRRGMYDRIFRFVPRFVNASCAARYALVQGRGMALGNDLS